MTTAMKVLAVDNLAIVAGVAEIRTAMKSGQAPGWHHVFFGTSTSPDNKIDDLLKKLTKLKASAISALEIVAEGRPWAIDSLDTQFIPGSAETFGQQLGTVPGISDTSNVYLSGCNTGLASTAAPGSADTDIAQLVANSSNANVYGARGYISGAHAFGNESVTEAFGNGGPFPGATHAHGAKCWRKCTAEPVPLVHTGFVVPPIPPLAPLTPEQIDMVLRDVAGVPFAGAPTFRVAAERIMPLPPLNGQPRVYHVIANGTFLRDATTYELWHNSQGHGLLTFARPVDTKKRE
jgi:hypothetical protein